MNNSYNRQSDSIQKSDGWFYATIGLAALFIITGVVFIAYRLGQTSAQEPVLAEKTTDIPKQNAVNNSDIKTSLSNTGLSQIPTVNKIAPSHSTDVSRTISGQVFIVTKGRQNIKLALVEICAVPENSILNWIKSKKNAAVAYQQKRQEDIASLAKQKSEIEGKISADPDQTEKWRLQETSNNLNYQLNIAKINLQYWTSPEYYLKDIDSFCEIKAKTDADGKYMLTLKRPERYALAAQTSRKVFDTSETYWWLIWENPQDKNQSIIFDNDNLMSVNPVNKVIEIKY